MVREYGPRMSEFRGSMPLYLELHLLSGSNFAGSVIWSSQEVLHPPALRAEDGFKALVFLRTTP